MKFFLFLLALALIALTVWTHRSRVGWAIKVATFAYLVMIVMNVFRFADDEESMTNVGLLLGGALLIWAAAWAVVSLIAKRREGKRRGPRANPPG